VKRKYDVVVGGPEFEGVASLRPSSVSAEL
jgi:hypothetical protein